MLLDDQENSELLVGVISLPVGNQQLNLEQFSCSVRVCLLVGSNQERFYVLGNFIAFFGALFDRNQDLTSVRSSLRFFVFSTSLKHFYEEKYTQVALNSSVYSPNYLASIFLTYYLASILYTLGPLKKPCSVVCIEL